MKAVKAQDGHTMYVTQWAKNCRLSDRHRQTLRPSDRTTLEPLASHGRCGPGDTATVGPDSSAARYPAVSVGGPDQGGVRPQRLRICGRALLLPLALHRPAVLAGADASQLHKRSICSKADRTTPRPA